MSAKEVKIGLLGLGTVGSGALNILQNNKQIIEDKVGIKIKAMKALVRDSSKFRDVLPDSIKLTSNPDDILDDPEIKIVVEVMGGIDSSKKYIEKALQNDKYVVTANKDLMATHGVELLKLAKEHNKNIYYEASVAAGIPIIRPLKNSLLANKIKSVIGIINGTTNYILTQMTMSEKAFDVALTEAQEKGFAEQDPSSDLEGRDAAYKIAILSALAFHSNVNIDQVCTEGITNITVKDIKYAKELGFVIKLLAIGEEENNKISLKVHPSLVPNTHPLAAVNNEFNAIFVEGDAVGEVMFYGKGAGSLPTGSAVVSDIIDAAKNTINEQEDSVSEISFHNKEVLAIEEQHSKFYLRIQANDQTGVFASLATIFAEEKVSLDMIIQKANEGHIAEIVLITHDVQEKRLRKALGKIELLEAIREISAIIRVLEITV